MLYLYNTRTHKKEEFKPLNSKEVGFYACGPTVYSYAHIGNFRSYVMEDVLRRVLEYNGFKVKHVMNITDVGHLTNDSDFGDDKLELASRRENLTAWDIAKKYEKEFFSDFSKLNLLSPHIVAHATEHILDMISLIQKLEKKGFTYRTSDGIYFDSSKFPKYGVLSEKKGILAGARVSLGEKKNPTDFALWKFSLGEKRQMEWDSPWGKGFPGWHIECSAMSSKYLGEQYDIHAGGEDHISIHHENEIAQSEACFGKTPWVNFWFHIFFLTLSGKRMGKSEGNFLTISELESQGFSPLSFRYLCLNSYYRTQLNFSLDSLSSAQNTLNRLYEIILNLLSNPFSTFPDKVPLYKEKFLSAINNDLQMSEALSIFWEMLRSDLGNREKYSLVLDFDKVLGLKLSELKILKPSSEIQKLLDKREEYRKSKKFKEADKIRDEISSKGYLIIDSPTGALIRKK